MSELARERSIFRLHCLNRLEKLQAKLEQPDWAMSMDRELGLLMQIQVTLTVMLHDLGIECYVGEDLDITEQLERRS